jgi:peptide alpha-N-acetyltransferase
MWFQTECALAYQKQQKWGEALKKCHEIDRHFTEIIEDQFDFHTYCMRKMTLKSYVDLLRLEDGLRSHRFYEKSATVAINVYLGLYDKPLQESDGSDDINTGDLDPSELKKRRNKAKKARRKAEQEKAAQEQLKVKKELHNKNQKKDEEELDTPTKDELIPDKLARTEEPLEEASKFLLPLQQLAGNKVNTHLLAFEIHYRKGRVLLMLQAIQRGLRANPDHSTFHWCLTRFLRFIAKKSSSFPAAMKTVLQKCQPEQLKEKTAEQLNSTFIQNHSNDLSALLIGARSMFLLDPSSQDKAVQLATNLDCKLQNNNLKTCRKVLEALSNGDLGAKGVLAKEAYRAECHLLHPLAVDFQSPTDKLTSGKSSQINNTESVGEF